MDNSIITELHASNWSGRFTYEGAAGSFNANGGKILQNISGSKDGFGSFDAYNNGDSWEYNPHFSDPAKAAELIAIMTGAISAVQQELSAS